jgi:hypothetical protein
MSRHKRLIEVIAIDTYFSSVKFIEGYHCAQEFFCMTAERLYVAGMKTESEFPDVCLDFISNVVCHLHSDVFALLINVQNHTVHGRILQN